ncbi:MAG: glutamate--tRNA ligase [Chitinophagaceae bacterium]|nr:MAG: glutamate--tRNA ligase [Chitinophagaceae bacterium]
MSDKNKIRVRFAPSPTGPLHIGGVRTALYNYLFAKHNGGTFILRIEDTDQTRYIEGAEKYIIESLEWCGIKCDEGPHVGGNYGPYRQSERKDTYRVHAENLVAKGHAYYAFDTPEELEAMRERLKGQGVPSPQYNHLSREYMRNSLTLSADETQKLIADGTPYVIRIKMPRNEEVKFEDVIRSWIVFQTNQLDDKVLYKSDGMPTYHLANVVDDYNMEISHVIRGEEWLPSAPLHVMLYKYLGWEDKMPRFAHVPLILRPDGKGKLSKRDGDKLGVPVFPLDWEDPTSKEKAMGFREQGYLKESFLNILLFLGWNPGTEKEIYQLDEMIQDFSLERVGKAGAKFDVDKAKWFNQQHLKIKSNEDLLELVKPYLNDTIKQKPEQFLLKFIELMKERATSPQDFYESGKYFFGLPESYDEKMIAKKWNDKTEVFFKELLDQLSSSAMFDATQFENQLKVLMDKQQMKMGEVLPVLRIMLSGTMQGPPVFELAELLGKEVVEERIKHAIVSFPALIN